MRSAQSWFYRGWQAMQAAAGDATDGALARRGHAVVDALVADSPDRDVRACAMGCDFCCHYPVGVTSAEADALVSHLAATMTVGQLEQLSQAVAKEARLGLSWRQRAAQRRRCVLLSEDRRCRAYAARPVACRGWHSRSRDACEGAHQRRPHLPEVDGAAYAAALGVHRGLTEATGEGQSRELTDALGDALLRM